MSPSRPPLYYAWVACLLPGAAAYVLMPINITSLVDSLQELPQEAYRWDVPAESSDNSGLGGGIQWYLNPAFCDEMIQQFPEESVAGYLNVMPFVTCTDILDAIQRGFETWEANHKSLRFTDVTTSALCANATGSASSDPCPWELYIGTDDGSQLPDLAAYVVNYRASHLGESFATVRSPSGVEVAGVDAFRRSVMKFQTHICWYLDATFCYYFHMGEADGVDVLLIVRISLIMLFTLASARVCAILILALWALVDGRCCPSGKPSRVAPETAQRRRWRLNCRGTLDYLSTVSPGTTIVALFFVIFPPVFYDRIFLPCWQCYDFEAAVAHELGHVLGFDHPDTNAGHNLEATCEVTNATCANPFGCSELQPYADASLSIMHSLTRSLPRTCLAETDRAGLHALYPVCDGLQPTEVACSKSTQLSGWLRLASVVGLPFLLVVVVIMVPLHFTRRRDRRRIVRLSQDLTTLNGRFRSLAAYAAALRPGTSSRPGTSTRRIFARAGRPPSAQPRPNAAAKGVAPLKPAAAANGGPEGRPQLLVIKEVDEVAPFKTLQAGGAGPRRQADPRTSGVRQQAWTEQPPSARGTGRSEARPVQKASPRPPADSARHSARDASQHDSDRRRKQGAKL